MRPIVYLLLIATLALAACGDAQTTPDQPDPSDASPDNTTNAPDSADAEPDVIIQVEGENFVFIIDGEENPTLTVQQGDLVRIEFTSTEGFHDFVIDEFGATAQVMAPDSTSVEFVADETGTFSYYCSVGNHRERGMEGTFIVE